MTPTSNNIFIEPIEKKITSLFIPPKYAQRIKQFSSGKVVAIGRKVTEVEVGEEVAFTKDFGAEVEIGEKKFVVIKPSHILAVE